MNDFSKELMDELDQWKKPLRLLPVVMAYLLLLFHRDSSNNSSANIVYKLVYMIVYKAVYKQTDWRWLNGMV